MCLIKLVRPGIRSQGRVFFLSCGHRHAGKDSERLVLRAVATIFRPCFVTIRKKPKKSWFYRRAAPDKKINCKDVNVDYGTTENIPEDMCSLRAVPRFDILDLK